MRFLWLSGTLLTEVHETSTLRVTVNMNTYHVFFLGMTMVSADSATTMRRMCDFNVTETLQ